MRKIFNITSSDRVLCVTESFRTKQEKLTANRYKDEWYTKTITHGQHSFYYQPTRSSQPIYLFSTKRYSPSIANFFAKNGLLVQDDNYIQSRSITLRELYRLHRYQSNYILDAILNRIPVAINDVNLCKFDGLDLSSDYSLPAPVSKKVDIGCCGTERIA